MNKINYEKFLTYKDIESHLLYLADKFPQTLKLKIIEATDEGRNIYLTEISDNVQSSETDEKGGYYVQGSIHANECGGTSAAMHLIDTLVYEKPEILKKVVFYIVLRVNPDNVEKNMLTNAEVRSKTVRDPRRKENIIISQDHDGDGRILQMHRKNPLGNSKEMAPGVMVPIEPGEIEGVFYDVYEEGIFDNYSGGKYNYGIRNYDFNRSYSSTWTPKPNSTEYPFREKELRAIAEFLVTHPNIFSRLNFHNGTSGILCPAMKPDSMMNSEDLELIVKVGEIASEITELPLIQEYKYGAVDRGCLRNGGTNEFFHNNLGISHYIIELGNGLNDLGIRTDEFEKGSRSFVSYLIDIKEYEEANGNILFCPFKPFNHP